MTVPGYLKRLYRVRYVLGAGFAGMLMLMLFLTAIGLQHMAATQAQLDTLVKEYMTKMRVVAAMRAHARERTVNMQKMILLRDPFDIRDQMVQFDLHAGSFIDLRQQLVAMPLAPEERQILDRQSRLTKIAVPLQRRVVTLVQSNRRDDAHRLLVEKAIPAQDKVFEVLRELEDLQQKRADAAVAQATSALERARLWVVSLSVATLALGVWIAWVVLRHTRRSERALREEKERAQVTLHSIGEAVIRTDAKGIVEYLNPVAERLTGWSQRDAAGRHLLEVMPIVHDATREPVQDPVSLAVSVGTVVTDAGDTVLLTRAHEEHAIEHTVTPIRDGGGGTAGAVVVLRDVTEMRALGRELVHQATHDPMTGLLNRREFERRLQQALDRARDGSAGALCYLDLDLFKTVNDTCGHLAGDELLKQLSLLLRSRVRKEDVMARVGGDEFAVLLFDCPLKKATEIADTLRRALRDFRFVWDDKSIDVGASIGVVRVAESSGDINDVLRAADVACRIAKEEGRNRIHLYQPDDLTVTRHHSEIGWVQRINRAIQHDQFVLYGQWIMPLARGRQLVPHCEVLVHLAEDDGIVAPIAFLSAAERYHLMPAVDRWVIGAVFRALRALPPDSSVSFNVNLSGQTLCDAEFLPFVQRALRQSGVSAARICFEITETAAVTHMSRAVGLIGALREAGCSFALDDFGSGLSSFTYLKTMPVDYLKIDGAFVRNAPADATDLAMVSSINQVAHIMGIRTIAEYVETDTIRSTLESIGVDYGQGYALARPQPLSEILDEIVKGHPSIAHG